MAATLEGYMPGFGNDFETEALPGALPARQNSPQRCAYGLYAEQLSGSPFTAPRGKNERSWLYRIRPSVKHTGRFKNVAIPFWRTAPAAHEAERPIGQLRWGLVPIPKERLTFVEGVRTITTAGDVNTQTGMSASLYFVTQSMADEYFYNADGELLVVPQLGRLIFFTEFGRIGVGPGEICLIPRGVKFKVALEDGPARGYLCENYGAKFTLPNRGPIGANCLANPRDFKTPVAAFEDKDAPCRLTVKWCGTFYSCDLDHSPARCCRLAWQLRALQIRSEDLRSHRRAFVRSSRPVHLHGADCAFGRGRDCECGLRNISRALGGGRAFVPPALVSHEHHERVHGPDLGAIRGKARGLPAGRYVAAQLHAAARPGCAIFRTRLRS